MLDVGYINWLHTLCEYVWYMVHLMALSFASTTEIDQTKQPSFHGYSLYDTLYGEMNKKS